MRLVADPDVPVGRDPGQAGMKLADPAPEDDDGNVVLMLTSGTTGRPKRVPLAYDKLSAAYNAAGHGAELEAAPRLKTGAAILWTSMVHIGGMYYAIGNVVEGRTIALLEKFDVQRWAQAITDHQPRSGVAEPDGHADGARLGPARRPAVVDAGGDVRHGAAAPGAARRRSRRASACRS